MTTALILILAMSYGAEAATWARVDSPNFSVVGDVGERQLRDVALRFEQFREAIGQLVPGAQLVSPAPVVIIVFGSQRQHQEFVWQQPGQRVRASGQFIAGTDVVYITMSLNRESEALRVVFHEYTHLLESNTLVPLPFWLREGLCRCRNSCQPTPTRCTDDTLSVSQVSFN